MTIGYNFRVASFSEQLVLFESLSFTMFKSNPSASHSHPDTQIDRKIDISQYLIEERQEFLNDLIMTSYNIDGQRRQDVKVSQLSPIYALILVIVVLLAMSLLIAVQY